MTFASRFRRLFPYFALMLLWIVSRIAVASQCEFWSQWEIFQARKLLEYGFWERSGALTWMHVMTGTMPHPEDLNSSTHPYPGVWMYTALYALGGARLCLTFAVTFKVASSLAVYALLRRWFTPRAAWLGGALYILAPVMIVMDWESNIIGLTAALFPFGMHLALAVREGKARAWWLGLLALVGGLIDWSFYYQMPALLWMAAPAGARWLELWPGLVRWPATRALLLGATLAVAAFLVQLAVFIPDLAAALFYIRRQTGVAGMDVSRARMLGAVAARNVFFVGPALMLAAAVGLLWLRRATQARRALECSLVFCIGFIPVELLFLHFCFVEFSQFAFLVLPASILAAHSFEMLRTRWYPALVLPLAVVMAAFFSFRASVPRMTEAARAIAGEIAAHTLPSEVVMTNLRSNNPPFESWDTGGLGAVGLLADRMIGPDIDGWPRVEALAGFARRNFASAVFAYSPDHPIAPELKAAIDAGSEMFARRTFTPPPQATPLAAKVRLAIWKLSGRYAQRATGTDPTRAPVTLEFYRLREGWAGTMRAENR